MIAGLRDIGTERLVLRGEKLRANVSGAVERASLERTIDGSSLLTLGLRDPDRALIRSNLFNSRVSLKLDELLFEFAGYAKAGNALDVTFRSAGIRDLQRQKGAKVTAHKTETRTEFARRLVSEAGVKWLKFKGDPGDPNKVTFARGKNESTWKALTRLAEERQWRCFEDEGTIFFGSDAWLLSLGTPVTISEDDAGIDAIDPTYDGRRRATSCTVTCWANRWASRPGAAVIIEGLGDLASEGKWLVSAIRRELFSSRATIDLVRKTPELPEPKPEPVSGGGDFIGGPISGDREEILTELARGFISVGQRDLANFVTSDDFYVWINAESGWNPQNVSPANNQGKVNGGLPQFWAGHSWAVPYFSAGVTTSYSAGNRFTMPVADQAIAMVQYFGLTVSEVQRYAAAIRNGSYVGWG